MGNQSDPFGISRFSRVSGCGLVICRSIDYRDNPKTNTFYLFLFFFQITLIRIFVWRIYVPVRWPVPIDSIALVGSCGRASLGRGETDRRLIEPILEFCGFSAISRPPSPSSKRTISIQHTERLAVYARCRRARSRLTHVLSRRGVSGVCLITTRRE